MDSLADLIRILVNVFLAAIFGFILALNMKGILYLALITMTEDAFIFATAFFTGITFIKITPKLH